MVVLFVFAGFSWGAESPTYKPPETTVVILPIINQAEGTEESKKEQSQEAADFLRFQFVGRKFQVMEDSKVQQAVKDLRLDLNDSENRTKANYAKIAEALGARLVVATVIIEIHSDYKITVLGSRKVGRAKVEVKVFDAQTQEYVCVQVANGSQKGQVLFPYLSNAKELRYGALDKAIESGLKDFLKPYPLPQEKGESGAKGSEQKKE
jgi:hypothetical protein